MLTMRPRILYKATLGLLGGYLLSQALDFLIAPLATPFIQSAMHLFGFAMGFFTASKAVDECSLCLRPAQNKKDLLLDSSILFDARILDLAASGLFDHQLVLPRVWIQELIATADTNPRARRALEIAKKLETSPNLGLRYTDLDVPAKDPISKMMALAHELNADIFTADISRIQAPAIEGIKIINLHSLANALKPLMQAGEQIKIKIQRYGKEPSQGVGYLEDGTMVVVNGGGEFLGQETYANVLSVKHSSAGRMVFCNAAMEGAFEPAEEQ